MARTKTSCAIHVAGGTAYLYHVRSGQKGIQVLHDLTVPPRDGADPPAPDWAALRSRVGKRVREAVIGFPADGVLFRVVRLPATSPEELPPMLEAQIEKLSPFPTEEIGWDYIVLYQTEESISVAVAITRVERIEETLAPLREAGFEPVGLDLDVLGVDRWLRDEGRGVGPGWTGLVYCSNGHASLLVSRDGVPQALRPLPLPDEDAELEGEFARTITAVAADVGTVPEQITVVGATATADRIAAAARASGTTVDRVSPDEVPGSPAVGLVRRALEPKERRIDLLPAFWHRRRERGARLRTLVRALTALAIFCVLGAAVFFQIVRMRQNRLVALDTRIREIQPQLLLARKFQQQNGVVGGFVAVGDSGLEMLRLVSEKMPDGVSLTQYTFRKNQRVTVRGLAVTKKDATDFLANLEAAGRFPEVRTTFIRDRPSRGAPGGAEMAQEFEFVCGSEVEAAGAGATRPVRGTRP